MLETRYQRPIQWRRVYTVTEKMEDGRSGITIRLHTRPGVGRMRYERTGTLCGVSNRQRFAIFGIRLPPAPYAYRNPRHFGIGTLLRHMVGRFLQQSHVPQTIAPYDRLRMSEEERSLGVRPFISYYHQRCDDRLRGGCKSRNVNVFLAECLILWRRLPESQRTIYYNRARVTMLRELSEAQIKHQGKK